MPPLQRAQLFRRGGPQATLQYAWRRLEERDLSGGEALAILGALHRQLGDCEAQVPGLYASYSRLMQTLSVQMPAVHHYVVAAWTENHFATRMRWSKQPASSQVKLDEPSPDLDAGKKLAEP